MSCMRGDNESLEELRASCSLGRPFRYEIGFGVWGSGWGFGFGVKGLDPASGACALRRRASLPSLCRSPQCLGACVAWKAGAQKLTGSQSGTW